MVLERFLKSLRFLQLFVLVNHFKKILALLNNIVLTYFLDLKFGLQIVIVVFEFAHQSNSYGFKLAFIQNFLNLGFLISLS